MQCPSCGSRDIDFHEAGGHSACVNCGTVVEENVIVSSIEFQVENHYELEYPFFVLVKCTCCAFFEITFFP